MDFHLTDDQRMIVDSVRSFAKKELAPKAAEVDRTGVFPLESHRKLAELGLIGMNVSEKYGGSEAGAVALSLALTEIAVADASIAVTMSVSNMVAETIAAGATEAQKERFIPQICGGDYPIGAFALSEAGAGTDATALKTRAVRDGDDYILNGTKTFITSAAFASVILVMARTSDEPGAKGITAFLVERGAPGMSVGKEEHKMGIRGSNTAELIFENCRIPENQRIGGEGEGFKVAMTALDGGRIGIASQALGIGKAAFDASIQYAKEREAFGRPIAKFQAIQWKLADMATELDAAQLLTRRAARLKEDKKPFTKEASMAKVFSTEAANRACREAVQIFGGYGYCSEYPVERYMRDCKVTTIYEGTSEVQRIVIARHLLQ
jgi:butyryl-CoA dehydrogenase